MKGSVKKYKTKTGNTKWAYTIFISHNKGGRKRVAGFDKMKDAEAAMETRIKELNRLNGAKDDYSLVKDFSEMYFDIKKDSGIEVTTANRYKIFRNQINEHLGNIKLIELNVMNIEKFYSTLKTDRKLSNSSILKTHRYLKMMLDYGVKKGLIDKNPADFADKPTPGKYQYTVWDTNDINDNLEKLKDSFLVNVITMAIFTGARLGELLALTWDDVDLNLNEMCFNKSIAVVDNKIILKKQKTTKSKRTIVILDELIPFLRKMRTRIDTNLVLHDLNGQYWNPKYISKAFRSELKKYNVQSLRFHDIRHSHATMLLRVGVDPKIISDRLGHSDVAFTLQTYTHPSLDHQKTEMQKLKAFLSK